MEKEPKPYRDEFEALKQKHTIEEAEFVDRAYKEALGDNQKIDELSQEVDGIERERDSGEIMVEKMARYGRTLDQQGYVRTSAAPLSSGEPSSFERRISHVLTRISQNNAEKIVVIDCDHELDIKSKVARKAGFPVIVANEAEIDLYKSILESEEKIIVI